MKKESFFALLVVICLCTSSASFAKNIITLGTAHYPPYTIGEEGGNLTGGLELDIINEINNRLDDVELQVVVYPFKRGHQYAMDGKIDGFWLIVETEEHKKYLTFSVPLREDRASFWYLRSRYPEGISWDTLSDLLPYSIGVVSGYSVNRHLLDALNQGLPLKLDFTGTVDQNFLKLLEGRLDIAIFHDEVACSLIEKNKCEGRLANMEKPIEISPFHIGFSKKSPAVNFIPRINQVILELKSEGFIEKILKSEE